MKINAIEIPDGAGEELEKRFASRAGSIDSSPGFLGFEVLRPVKGDNRYFVYTKWETEDDFQNWVQGRAKEAHAREKRDPVSTGASLLEFEVILRSDPPA